MTLGSRFKIISKTLNRHPGVIPPAALDFGSWVMVGRVGAQACLSPLFGAY